MSPTNYPDAKTTPDETPESLALFRTAVAALDAGDVAQLTSLLDLSPWLITFRCREGQLYESGYFAGATLLNHVAGNPIRCSLPANIFEITQLLLGRGAAADTERLKYTVGLLLTSRQASEAGVALPLIDLLVAAGNIEVDLLSSEALDGPITNCAPATARAMIERGAAVDIRHHAAFGEIDALAARLGQPIDQEALERALVFACFCGQEAAANLLLKHGAVGDVLIMPNGQPQTALHLAAYNGWREVCEAMIFNGADATVIEPQWNGTPAGWAREGGHTNLFELLNRRAGEQAAKIGT